MRIASARASSVRAAATPDAEQVTGLAPGEEFAVLDISGGWAWGYRRADHRVGYVPIDELED